MGRRVTWAIAALSALASPAVTAQGVDPGAAIQPAADGIFDAFHIHPLVGLGDDHGLAPGMEFYAELVRDPRFARDVGNVVVEFGAARHQRVVDRYLDGERVPYTELRQVWSDTIGWIPPVGYLGFARFLATVRTVNKSLPPQQRVRVWLGEPPIDWTDPTREQLMAAMSARDSHPADVIEREILAKQRKALVIYGHAHLTGGPALRGRVEARHPGAFFVVVPYSAAHRPPGCASLLEQTGPILSKPVLAMPGPAGASGALRECLMRGRQSFDAVLLFGPPDTLPRGPYMPDYVLDTALRLEMQRRGQLGSVPLVRFPASVTLRRSDYRVDLDAPGFEESMDGMFARHDSNGDGIVTAAEYEDPVPR